MAEAFARIHGKDMVEAYSSGSNPSGIVSEKAINAMRRAGYDLSTHTSKPLDKLPDIEYDIVISMGCNDACPSVSARQKQEWNIPDPENMDMDEFLKVRDLIEKNVKQLLNNIIKSD